MAIAAVPGSRLDFASAVVGALGGRINVQDGINPSDAVRLVVAWEQLEGGNNGNPLNIGPGKTYPTLTAGAADTVHELNGSIFYVIRDAIRACGPTDRAGVVAITQALQSVPWCFENGVICPGYGARVLDIFDSHKGNPAAFLASANTIVGTSATGATILVGGGLSSASAIGQANDIQIPGEGLITSTADVLAALGRIAAWLLDPSNWRRAGIIAGGAALVGLGVAVINRDTLTDAAKTAGKAAVLA